MTNMCDFSAALWDLKHGHRVARDHWGPGRYVVLMPGYPDGIGANDATAQAHGVEPGTVMVVKPYFMARTREGELVPWTAKPTDLLAEDWAIVG
jgi:hypothetical protein